MVHTGKLHIVHMDGRARAAACGERYVDRFVGIMLLDTENVIYVCNIKIFRVRKYRQLK
jgi:hypothetical protein